MFEYPVFVTTTDLKASLNEGHINQKVPEKGTIRSYIQQGWLL